MDKLEAQLMASGGIEFVSDGNNAELVKLIKEAAIFKYEVGESVGTLNGQWQPASGKQPLGYFSEDGITIHPEAGDSNDFSAHNGDTVVSWNSGGYWTVQFSGLESKKEVIETYFDTTVDATGAITIDKAECNKAAQYVIAGLTQDGNLIVLHVPKAKVGEREDVVWKISELMSYGMTLRLFRDAPKDKYFFKAWGFAQGA
ncbi:hypothetical protein [Bifidobacterium cuniculi]|uniref:Bacterial Ig-like domain, group 2 n=1 Tax=Bifidobacterium cuniculi TaxID=1688 RepID=A0A087B409_9BIFI|nr:hypothetical protein [Bifidobacterium cuniculi]KFI65759.1 bacterial Ig-like domain, group 2 [Bifidobacterium cuniculi]